MTRGTIENYQYESVIIVHDKPEYGVRLYYLEICLSDRGKNIISIPLEGLAISDYGGRFNAMKETFDIAFQEFCKAIMRFPDKELRNEFDELLTRSIYDFFHRNIPTVRKQEPEPEFKIDPEIKSASFIAEEAMKMGREAKEKIEYIEKLKNDHTKKYGTFLEKCRAYIK